MRASVTGEPPIRIRVSVYLETLEELERGIARKQPGKAAARDGEAGDRFGKRLRSVTRMDSLPAMLRRNGLLQTVYFLRSKARGEQDEEEFEALQDDGLILSVLAKMMADFRQPGEIHVDSARKWLLAQLEQSRNNPLAYLFLQEIAIEASVWIKRWIDALTVEENLSRQIAAGEQEREP
jgi:CRISPR/Cas system CMR-associated protein Cmr5 small subunit